MCWWRAANVCHAGPAGRAWQDFAAFGPICFRLECRGRRLDIVGYGWSGYMLFFPRRFAQVFLHIVLPFALVSHPGWGVKLFVVLNVRCKRLLVPNLYCRFTRALRTLCGGLPWWLERDSAGNGRVWGGWGGASVARNKWVGCWRCCCCCWMGSRRWCNANTAWFGGSKCASRLVLILGWYAWIAACCHRGRLCLFGRACQPASQGRQIRPCCGNWFAEMNVKQLSESEPRQQILRWKGKMKTEQNFRRALVSFQPHRFCIGHCRRGKFRGWRTNFLRFYATCDNVPGINTRYVQCMFHVSKAKGNDSITSRSTSSYFGLPSTSLALPSLPF